MSVFALVRYITNAGRVSDVRIVAVLSTRWEAENASRIFTEAHDRIAGDATFVVKEMGASR